MTFFRGTEDRSLWSAACLTAVLTLTACTQGGGAGSPRVETEGAGVEGEASPADPSAVADDIEDLLTQVVRAYRAGDAERAAELSAEAYLENYEHIEDDVIEHAPQVNEELETLLGADLRARVRAGAPAHEIRRMTERAEDLLADAVAALEGKK